MFRKVTLLFENKIDFFLFQNYLLRWLIVSFQLNLLQVFSNLHFKYCIILETYKTSMYPTLSANIVIFLWLLQYWRLQWSISIHQEATRGSQSHWLRIPIHPKAKKGLMSQRNKMSSNMYYMSHFWYKEPKHINVSVERIPVFNTIVAASWWPNSLISFYFA